jgi:hypothetical protein
MKIKVNYKKHFGVEMFYPADDWTKNFLQVFHPPSIKTKCFSRRQLDGLKSLGFEIDVIVEQVEI